MLKLDHLTVIAPTLGEGVAHVRECLGLEVPFGTRHPYMGTHNHRLMLGRSVYLEIVAVDPSGEPPPYARWFGLDDQARVRADWDSGRRLRSWVAGTENLSRSLARHGDRLGRALLLPTGAPEFGFAIPVDGSLPLDGAAPSILDRHGVPTPVAAIPDLGARLKSFTLSHPDIQMITEIYEELRIDHPPAIVTGPAVRYWADIETPAGLKRLT